MTLIQHFEELRKRLLIALVAWVVGAAVAYGFRFMVLEWLREPLPPGMTLNYFAVLEPFTVSMQISAFFGLVLASPVVIGQVWGFVAPGLYREERRYAIPFIFSAAFAFVAGVAFSYYVVLPFTIPILLSFLGNEAQGLLSIGRYISTLLMIMAVFGIMFELPVLGFLFARMGVLRSEPLVKNRRWSIVIGLVVAAVVTPTGDPFNLALVAVPLLVLYEVTILVVKVAEPKRREAVSMDHAREDPKPTS